MPLRHGESTTPGVAPADCYCIDDLLVDIRVRQVTREGIGLAIAGLSFDLLVELIRAAPNLVSSNALMETVWKGIIVSPETVTQRVKILRQALGDTADHPRYIAARRGYGYRLVTMPVGVEASAQITIGTPPAVRISHRALYIALAALALTVAASSFALERVNADRGIGHRPGNSLASPDGSIAVMPFVNLTGEPDKEYFSDDITEELIGTLTQVPGLKVPARTSAFIYKGHQSDIRRIAQDLGVATILEGSVRSAGERVRVSARLVDAHTGFEIWSQNYDRQFGDIFKLQDDLAVQIVKALRGYLKSDLPAPVTRPPPSQNLQAYQLYLQARSAGKGTAASEQRALVLVGQAISRDPDFARALAYRAFLRSASVGMASEALPTLDGAERDATRALTLSPGLGEAYAALGQIDAVRGRWVKAEQGFHYALAADPTDPWIRNLYTLFVLRPAGRLREARSQLEGSYRLSPAYDFTAHELALTSSLTGNDTDLMKFAQLGQALDDRPAIWDIQLAYAYADARAGRYADAAKQADAALPAVLREAGGAAAMGALFDAAYDPGRRPAALQALQHLQPSLFSPGVDGRTKAFFLDTFTMIGAMDSAYALANGFLDERPATHGSVDWSDLWLPEMRPFRRDPRFAGLIGRLGLMEYWKQYGPPDAYDLNGAQLSCP
ncbi:MAG TPA: winged helix-turn-helix domain-containing protein [Steroidobacteraceae bacterium]